ncbi:cyclophane-forming radical SAM/SPASM peptide maturase YhhB [uncultured Enterovirga sp.]|uniref:cyclophane-forming radical SAM/SPASM peptide maturase YhhB n=1 Tax=uncultured Enterovirga sp. TaxID=2026352 RepID=UPI0035C9CFF8
MVTVDTVLLKLASRCNLDCHYCYVYNMGDEGWLAQPKRMSPEVIDSAVAQLSLLASSQDVPFSVVFHGGEPLLIGAERFDVVCAALRGALPPTCGLHLQTNGLLLSDAVLRTCMEHDVGVSISLDGPAAVHDRHRPDRRGAGSHSRVMEAVRRLSEHPAGSRLFTGVLAVVDLASDPGEVYSFLKSTGAPSMDFLYRDGNHDEVPVGKASPLSTEYGDWMCRLLDVYLADRRPVPIRVLDDMLKLLMGGISRKEGVGLDAYGILVVDTDGSVRKNDTLKSAFGAADRFASGWSVTTHDLRQVVASKEFAVYHHAQRPSSPVCLSCPDLRVCGGGMPAHRWRSETGFVNPSVFCADQRLLIDAMRDILSRRMLAA